MATLMCACMNAEPELENKTAYATIIHVAGLANQLYRHSPLESMPK